jgi:UDP-N-acetylmuramoyl-tripeptide--D-alanyl-D-alanine ligase
MRGAGYEVRAGDDVAITGGAADSRSVEAGQLFTAFPGEHHDGNAFVDDAMQHGAAAVICSVAPSGEWQGRTIVIAPDPTRAVGQLAHAWRKTCNPRVVGITGTVGKTTAKELTAGLLAARFRTHRSEGNLNSREGLPLALLSLRREHEVSVLEIGMDSKGEIAYLCGIAEPEVGVVLNIGLTHVSKLGSIEAIAEEKLTLGRYAARAGTALVNIDDPRIAAEFGAATSHVLTFGESPGARLRVSNVVDRGLAGTAFDLSYGGETLPAMCPAPGVHVIPGALAAVGAALALGMNLADARDALAAVETAGRARVARSASGATIIDDRYNSSPASLAGALRMLGALEGRRIAFIGRMAELGDYEEEEHRKAGVVAASACDILFAVGPECSVLAAAARDAGHADVRWFETKESAAAEAASLLREGDTVLVKASRGAAFETVIPVLEGTA